MTDTPRASNAELRLLDVLWGEPGLTVRACAERLYGQPSAVQYRTVQVQLDRLEKKGLVSRDRTGTAHAFTPTVERDAFLGDQLQSLADRVCDGSLTPLLLNLAEHAELSEDDRRRLWRLLGEERNDG